MPKDKGKRDLGDGISFDDKGNLCFGDKCIKVQIPADRTGIDFDFSNCPDELKKRIAEQVIAGGDTRYRIGTPVNKDDKQNDKHIDK